MKFIVSMCFFLLLESLAIAQSQKNIQEAWKGFSDPEIFSSNFTHVLTALPLEGSMDIGPRAWSGDYWSSKKGGINYRWNAKEKVGWDYKSPTKEQVKSMTLAQLATLAPSEKYDLFMGRYSYPLRKEVEGSASKLAPDWAGICHGWAPAAIFHNEPTPKVMVNPDGIEIPFGSGDIKALISYFYAIYHNSSTDQMGLRCFFGSWMGGARGCGEDLNAGAFHIVIANKLGLQKEGFMMDVDRFRQVWNQPVVAYRSVIVAHNLRPSDNAAKLTAFEMRVITELFYVDESDPTWEVVHGTKEQKVIKKDLQYRLEMSAEGKIIGGEWESNERPDFLWNKLPATMDQFGGLLTDLPKLLND